MNTRSLDGSPFCAVRREKAANPKKRLDLHTKTGWNRHPPPASRLTHLAAGMDSHSKNTTQYFLHLRHIVYLFVHHLFFDGLRKIGGTSDGVLCVPVEQHHFSVLAPLFSITLRHEQAAQEKSYCKEPGKRAGKR